MMFPDRPFTHKESLDPFEDIFWLNDELHPDGTDLSHAQLSKLHYAKYLIGCNLSLLGATGMTIQRALDNKTPVLLLRSEGEPNELKCLFPKTDEKRGLHIWEYKDLTDAAQVINKFLLSES